MRRREFIKGIVGSAVTAWPFAAPAQQTGKMRVIGFLSPGSETSFISDFFDVLAESGWIEGKSRSTRFSALRRSTLGPLAAKRTTSTIPIVMTASGDPLGSGLVATLARPGGNVTGMSLMTPDIGGKRLELLKELLPRLARVAVLWNAANPYPPIVWGKYR